jgi:hypothetical protein
LAVEAVVGTVPQVKQEDLAVAPLVTQDQVQVQAQQDRDFRADQAIEQVPMHPVEEVARAAQDSLE